jgi:aspartyl-tRNA synthetase
MLLTGAESIREVILFPHLKQRQAVVQDTASKE